MFFLQACINPNKSIAICQLPANLLRSFVACRGSTLNVLTWAICVVPSMRPLIRSMCVHALQTCPASSLDAFEAEFVHMGLLCLIVLGQQSQKFRLTSFPYNSHSCPSCSLCLARVSKAFSTFLRKVDSNIYAYLLIPRFPPFLVKFVSKVCQHASFI